MSCPFYEGYGQTENTAAAFINDSVDPVSCQVGGVVVFTLLIIDWLGIQIVGYSWNAIYFWRYRWSRKANSSRRSLATRTWCVYGLLQRCRENLWCYHQRWVAENWRCGNASAREPGYEDHRQKEEHFQTAARIICCPRKSWGHLYQEPYRQWSFLAWLISP